MIYFQKIGLLFEDTLFNSLESSVIKHLFVKMFDL